MIERTFLNEVTAMLCDLIRLPMLSDRATERAVASRRIRPSRAILLGIVTLLAGTGALALWSALHAGGGPWGIAIVFASLAVLLLPALLPSYDVTWTESEISGPANYAWPFRRPRQETLAFKDIRQAGRDALGSLYVESRSGTRILWSRSYAGHPALQQVLARHGITLLD